MSTSKRVIRYPKKKLRKEIKTVIKEHEKATTELKYLGYGAAAANIDNAAGNLWQMSSIAVGTGDSQRIGDEVCMRRIEIRYSLTAATVPRQCRVFVFQWNTAYDSTATAPTYQKLLAASAYNTSNSCNAPYNHDKRETFRVLYDRTHSLSGSSVQSSTIVIKKQLKKIKYFAGDTNYGTGQIFMFAVSTDNSLDRPVMSWMGRVYYTDA